MRVVAVDVGTSAVRSALVDADGTVVSTSEVRRESGLGGSTFDAVELHRDVVGALSRLDLRGTPAALAISAHIGTVAVDERTEPVDVAGSWADPRGVDELARVEPDLAADILRSAGRPSLTAGALAYLLSLSPEASQRIHTVLSPKDFLVARMSGRITTDTVNAAYTLAFDVRSRTWNRAVIEKLGIAAHVLPECVEPTSVVGTLSRTAAAETGLPADLPVVAGGPDGSVGIGLLLGTSSDIVADVGGTTDVVGRLMSGTDEGPGGAVMNPSVLPGQLIAGGATGMTGGAVARWRELVGAVDDQQLAALPPGSDGLVVLPAMTGARFPQWRPASRGALLGQRPEHGPAHLLRAAQEAAAFTLREGIDLLDMAGTRPVAFAGGSARSRNVAQLRADVLGRPMLVAQNPDVTLLGTALIALLGVGVTPAVDELRGNLLGEMRQILPQPVAARRYAELYGRWLELRDSADSVRTDVGGG